MKRDFLEDLMDEKIPEFNKFLKGKVRDNKKDEYVRDLIRRYYAPSRLKEYTLEDFGELNYKNLIIEDYKEIKRRGLRYFSGYLFSNLLK